MEAAAPGRPIEGEIAVVSRRLARGGRQADVTISPVADTWTVTLTIMALTDGRIAFEARRPPGTLRTGRARSVAVELPSLRSGRATGVVAQLSTAPGFVQSKFLAAEPLPGWW